ncbi:MAG TPA: carbamoyl-phosphate synthase large subunit [Anaerolineaceae bacterium]
MPKRTDIHSILIPGSGPIVIGQAAEFDYSGTQAVRALKKEGYRIILVNSNPATVMTDPELADATYIEPLTPTAVDAIIAQERPDALLPTVGGQTGLNLALALHENGTLERYNVQLIGASIDAIRKAEDRLVFRDTLTRAGIPVPVGGVVYSLEDAQALCTQTGFPVLVRASFALGGSGATFVRTAEELPEAVFRALGESSIHQAWLEESIVGWKEFELEVMRDRLDNFVVVCSIENLDPMGVHTGDSITVAPAQTLTDREYQVLRDLARQVMSAVGVETGGANVQFAVNPHTGRVLVIEMNPRVSRSSALASKATGFPIAKIAALVAAGYTLDEITNDITGKTRAAFEPSLDYVVVKIPRWAFEKFPWVESTLGPQMKSVGEVMALGRTFSEALGKAIQSLEIGVDSPDGSGSKRACPIDPPEKEFLKILARPTPDRLFAVYRALRAGISAKAIAEHTSIDPWFLAELQQMVEVEMEIRRWRAQKPNSGAISPDLLRRAKQMGFGDAWLSRLLEMTQVQVRQLRKALGVLPVYQQVDTCAAEFASSTPYLYSCYETLDEAPPTNNQKILILGGGPNRIGQGIEFDYCCCQAAFSLADTYEILMQNCNPETVSTDYDISNRLYFEPLTLEHVLNIVDREKPVGVILQFGGQTPLNLAKDLEAAGVPVLGTSPAAIALAEDREQFADLLVRLDIAHPEYGITRTIEGGRAVARQIGYPVLVRPSYVLSGRAMAIVGDETQLDSFVQIAFDAAPGQPVLIDRFMEDAYEIDVDALADGERVVIGAIMQHIEEAGVHSGDSACILPPYKVSAFHQQIIREYTEKLGLALKVKGILNVQYAIKDDIVYVLEVNPRASRTVPFVSKATGRSLARIAARIMAGDTLKHMGILEEPKVDGFFVKEAVLPFNKLPNSVTVLGPEMRSTGEVMGHAAHFGHAFAKSQSAAGMDLPLAGNVLISVNDFDKSAALKIAQDLHRMGFGLFATPGTAAYFQRIGLPVQIVQHLGDGSPNSVDVIRSGKVQMVLNTPLGATSHSDGARIRAAAITYKIPLLTTLSAAAAAVAAIHAIQKKDFTYRSLQQHFKTK